MEVMDKVCNSYLEVNMSIIKDNIKKIRDNIGPDTDIMAVLKGNAYGMGLKEIAEFIVKECGIKALACAQTYEALKFREIGIENDIFVMGGVPFNNISAVIKHNIQTPAYNKRYIELLNEKARLSGKKAEVHLKIETGLNRIGVLPGKDLDEFCKFLKTMDSINVIGVYTHFAQSDNPDKGFTIEQFHKFKNALFQIEKYNFKFRYIHACNTAASTWLKDSGLTHIRPAGLLFGFDNNIEPKNLFHLQEALSWRAFITNVKFVEKGETVGYNRAFKAERKTKIATVSVGYGDGYPRHLAASMKAHMIVNGKRAKIIGVCMDQIFLDVTDMDVNINDTVTLMGKDGEEYISVFELQKKMHQTYLVSIATIANRVKRFYIYNN